MTIGPQRSPDTPAWRAVQAIYRQPSIDPAQLVSAVVRAAAEYPERLAHDPSIQIWLQVLLEWPDDRGSTEATLELCDRAEREIAHRGLASFYSDFGRNAAHRVSLRGLVADRHVRVDQFVRELAAAAIEYLVARDITRYLGTKALPDISRLIELEQRVGEIIRAARIPVANLAQAENASLERLLGAAWADLASAGCGAH